jgi:nucleoside-diphosphate-sugar epimerase
MRILVIGGTGFIGPCVVRSLVKRGHEVTVFHRGRTQADLPAEVHHILCGKDGDLPTLADWIERVPYYVDDFRRVAPDVVIYMIPLGEEDTRTVVQSLQGIAQRIVGVSSMDVYRAFGRVNRGEPGPPDPLPLTEDSPLRERLFPYRGEVPRKPDDPARIMDNYDKILVERVILRNPDFPGTILRLPMVYGPRDNQHRLFEYLKRMDDGRPAILFDEASAQWRWTRGYVENVADAIALAATDERAAGRIYNVGEPNVLSMREWVEAIAKAVGWKGKIVTVPQDRLPTHLDLGIDASQHLAAETQHIRRELDYSEQIAFEEGLRRTIDWERANPPRKIDPKQFDYAAEDAALAAL